MSGEFESVLREMREIVERLERENRELRAESNRLGRENDVACDQIYDLQQQLSAMREAAE